MTVLVNTLEELDLLNAMEKVARRRGSGLLNQLVGSYSNLAKLYVVLTKAQLLWSENPKKSSHADRGPRSRVCAR